MKIGEIGRLADLEVNDLRQQWSQARHAQFDTATIREELGDKIYERRVKEGKFERYVLAPPEARLAQKLLMDSGKLLRDPLKRRAFLKARRTASAKLRAALEPTIPGQYVSTRVTYEKELGRDTRIIVRINPGDDTDFDQIQWDLAEIEREKLRIAKLFLQRAAARKHTK